MSSQLSPAGADSDTAAERIRLVVWDLDETFWRGTLTEGGISEYVQAHHDIIVALANRGIMSSVCSKNNRDDVLPILEQKGILPYIIFPSISWDSKGMRLAALIETVGLRAPTVIFIDDNPNNLAEARAMVPGIQVANETFIADMLADARFAGKPDHELSRLKQYKLLEDKKRDEEKAGGDNSDFLRSCDIRVYIEHNVDDHIDRAIELINRTNQLNYTKERLPEDLEAARAVLLPACHKPQRQVGLVRVVDKYGDYGFVGFFMTKNRRTEAVPGLAYATLIHYAFSCRTLGMFVEQWLYDYLRRPELTVVGEVLTDLSQPRTIDWIRHVTSLDESAAPTVKDIPEIRVYGGCEANAVAHFLQPHAEKLTVTGNFAAGALFVIINSASILASTCRHRGAAFDAALTAVGVSPALMGGDYFDDAPRGTVFVFSGATDGSPPMVKRQRDRQHGWEIKVKANVGVNDQSQAGQPISAESRMQSLMERGRWSEAERSQLAAARGQLARYQPVSGPVGETLSAVMYELLARVPEGCKFIALLDDERYRKANGTVAPAPSKVQYNRHMKDLFASIPYATAIDIGDFVQSEAEIHAAGNHYDRMTYHRVSAHIVAAAAGLAAKSDSAVATAA